MTDLGALQKYRQRHQCGASGLTFVAGTRQERATIYQGGVLSDLNDLIAPTPFLTPHAGMDCWIPGGTRVRHAYGGGGCGGVLGG